MAARRPEESRGSEALVIEPRYMWRGHGHGACRGRGSLELLSPGPKALDPMLKIQAVGSKAVDPRTLDSDDDQPMVNQ